MAYDEKTAIFYLDRIEKFVKSDLQASVGVEYIRFFNNALAAWLLLSSVSPKLVGVQNGVVLFQIPANEASYRLIRKFLEDPLVPLNEYYSAVRTIRRKVSRVRRKLLETAGQRGPQHIPISDNQMRCGGPSCICQREGR
jgi:hypothetical protein